MPGYNSSFNLNVKEIDLIEPALRAQIGQLSSLEVPTGTSIEKENYDKTRDLMEVLGVLHNQKIWYGQVHNTGVPLG